MCRYSAPNGPPPYPPTGPGRILLNQPWPPGCESAQTHTHIVTLIITYTAPPGTLYNLGSALKNTLTLHSASVAPAWPRLPQGTDVLDASLPSARMVRKQTTWFSFLCIVFPFAGHVCMSARVSRTVMMCVWSCDEYSGRVTLRVFVSNLFCFPQGRAVLCLNSNEPL